MREALVVPAFMILLTTGVSLEPGPPLAEAAAELEATTTATTAAPPSKEADEAPEIEDDVCTDAPNRQLCMPKDYSKFELPFMNSVNVVEIGIDIIDVLRINDKEYSVTFSCYFNVLWQEPRLQISRNFLREQNASTYGNTGVDTMIPVDLELVNDLWLPNIFIYNLKTFKVVEVLSKHAGLWVTTNQDVFFSQATHITFICPMRFDSFPLDTQRCKFQVGSYSFDDTRMIFLETPRVKGYAETARSIVLDYDVFINPLSASDRLLSYGSLGNYSVAGFEMVMHRFVSHYIITYYLPSGLFVVVSWISFVVPPDVIPGRMALLITLFLVLVNIFNSVTTNTPKAEGLTAIEAWMLACILFVFGALVEYAVILFRTQKEHSYQQGMQLLFNGRDNLNDGHRCCGVSEAPIITSANNHYHLHRMMPCLPPHHPLHPQQRLLLQHHKTGSNLMAAGNETLPLDEEEPPASGCCCCKKASSGSASRENYIKVDRFFLVAMPLLFLAFNAIYWLSYGSHFILQVADGNVDSQLELGRGDETPPD